MPSSRSTKPSAPASTTPALRNTASCCGVSRNACCARASARSKELRKSRAPSSTACPHSAAKAWMTDRMVPSRGSASASRASREPSAAAAARAAGVRRALPARRSDRPWKNWAMIAPELPRAPSMASEATRRRTAPAWPRRRSRTTPSIAPRVKARLVPVSPSGTGNTLMRLISSRRAITRWIPAASARRKA